jgi:hypothetical protein
MPVEKKQQKKYLQDIATFKFQHQIFGMHFDHLNKSIDITLKGTAHK